MSTDLIFPEPRNNPEYQFYQVMSGYNYNFSSITATIDSITGVTPSSYFSSATANTFYINSELAPLSDNTADIGSTIKRFRNLNIVNGVSVGFTSNTISAQTIYTDQIFLSGVPIEDKFLSPYDILSGGTW
jgi:hypothetical protein